MVEAVVVALAHVLPFFVPPAYLSMGVLSAETTCLGSSVYFDPTADVFQFLLSGASWTRKAFLDLRCELGDVDFIARALSLFDEERLLVPAPLCH